MAYDFALSEGDVGRSVPMEGFVTTLRQLAVNDPTCERVGDLLGFQKECFADGYFLLKLHEAESIGPDEFAFAGYSYLSGGYGHG